MLKGIHSIVPIINSRKKKNFLCRTCKSPSQTYTHVSGSKFKTNLVPIIH